MTIPLDQLYHYVDQCAQQSHGDLVIIYRFWPHGSKEIKHLGFLNNYSMEQVLLHPQIFCHDQEPLDFERYEQETFLDAQSLAMVQSMNGQKMNLRDYPANVWDQAILLHSEQRSLNLDQYQSSAFVPVYYWSHALIALDWFRAAEYLSVTKQSTSCTFLIYNRAWSGTREYRLKFADLIVESGLQQDCQMTVNPVDPEINQHYRDHKFLNTSWQPVHELEQHFACNSALSSHSAVFDLNDYAVTDCEVVLETLFDDDRLHLTEKVLRPIACGQPFLLMATQGSLEYLRSYGFQTYEDIWPEDYDTIADPESRMQEVIRVMQHIRNWSAEERCARLARAAVIAEYNRQHFFSKNFSHLIMTELQTNLDQGLARLLANNTCRYWLSTQQFRSDIESKRTDSMHKQFTAQDWQRIIDCVNKLVADR